MRGTSNPLRYSLRTLLIVTTILSVCLALIPWLTIVCLAIAAIASATLAIAELAAYFHRATGFIAAITFFVIGCILFGIAGAVLFDQLPGYDGPWAKLVAIVAFGGFSVLGFLGARVAYHEALADEAEPPPDSAPSPKPSTDTPKQP